MAQKFYVVWQGRETGIFTDWATCKQQIDKFAGARYKSFKTRSEAEAAFGGSSVASSLTASGTAAKPRVRKPASKANSVKTWPAKEVDALSVDCKIFTDGGCEPNPGKAGSGLAFYRLANRDISQCQLESLWFGLYNPMGTNNTAELNALHQALILAKVELDNNRSVAIFCDSKYSIQCITQWAIGWQKKGWKKTGGEIKNLELIQQMFALHQQLIEQYAEQLQILHVNGHVGVEGNELADRMSILAIAQKPAEFIRYTEALDIKSILALRAG
ncbi:ribonuclease H family protein [Pelagibaculum spongiae]|uniref:ribonuclease H n=1 Tax=Pelagibaculum spongiae TaxID=2080658 RepID=A0A2V1H4E6_9GAMM|nr:ribonuclease H family protein [Pelagibaculum spongiae]PVZ72067.1 ribonuclease HI [Pelagibaculum spongiae]